MHLYCMIERRPNGSDMGFEGSRRDGTPLTKQKYISG